MDWFLYDRVKERVKVRLPPSKKIVLFFFNESPLIMMKTAFYFMLKVLFVLKIFKYLNFLVMQKTA